MSTTDDVIEPIYSSYVLFHNSSYFFSATVISEFRFSRLRDHSDNFSKPLPQALYFMRKIFALEKDIGVRRDSNHGLKAKKIFTKRVFSP